MQQLHRPTFDRICCTTISLSALLYLNCPAIVVSQGGAAAGLQWPPGVGEALVSCAELYVFSPPDSTSEPCSTDS